MRNDSKVQRLYAGRAAIYERLFVNFLGWGRELRLFFEKSQYIGPHSQILDAGCGTGVITKTLFHLAYEKKYEGIELHAFDLTANMLDVLERWIAKQQAKNIEVHQADVLEIETLPSHWKEYDLVISSTMLEYLPKDKVIFALNNLKHLLKTGGVLLIFVTKRNRITEWLARRWWQTNLFDEAEIETMLHEAGFDKVNFRTLSPGWSGSILVTETKK